ncbi:MAG: LacI family DNA-binding transcriptional regulator [Alphaproteobacteria bacterium]
MVKVVDVARRAGVSPTTVSRVVLGRAVVSAETRARVLEAVEALGYQPDPIAQGLRLGRGRSVAFLVGDIEQSVYSELTRQVQTELEAVGLELLLFNLGHSPERLLGLFDRAAALRLRGICLATSDVLPVAELKPRLARLAEQGIAVVSLRQRMDKLGVPSVVHDDAAASASAVERLVARGRAPVAFLGRIAQSATGAERFRGYRTGLERAGRALDPALIWEPTERYRYDAGYEAMANALDRGGAVRGVFCASDELALGAMAAALDRGRKVPDDLAFVGVGGMSWGAHVRPSLTTLAGDPAAVGARVRAIFEDLEAGRTPPRLHTVRMTLVERGSA